MLGTYIVICARLSTLMSFLWNLHYFDCYRSYFDCCIVRTQHLQMSYVSYTSGVSQVAGLPNSGDFLHVAGPPCLT